MHAVLLLLDSLSIRGTEAASVFPGNFLTFCAVKCGRREAGNKAAQVLNSSVDLLEAFV